MTLCNHCLSFEKCTKNQTLGLCSSYLEWAKEEEEYNWMDDIDVIENICNDGGFAGK